MDSNQVNTGDDVTCLCKSSCTFATCEYERIRFASCSGVIFCAMAFCCCSTFLIWLFKNGSYPNAKPVNTKIAAKNKNPEKVQSRHGQPTGNFSGLNC